MGQYLRVGEQFFDDDGNPLSGGSLTFSGTTYSDEEESVSNSNPITLNAAGRSPVDIYFTSAQTVTLKDSSGTTIDSQSNVLSGKPVSSTFTPVFGDGTNNATASVATGKQTKIADMNFIEISITLTSLGSVSGNIRITGQDSGSASNQALTVGLCDDLSITATESLVAYINGGNIFFGIWDATTGTTSPIDDSHFTNSSVINISGHYRLA